MEKKKLLKKDKKLLESLKKGGRSGVKKDLIALLKRTAKSLKS